MDIANELRYRTPYTTSPLLPLLLLSLSTQKHSPDTKSTFREEYDYIVVGAGSAGSVIASRLSEVPCVSVLLLEAGIPPPKLTEIPAISKSFWNTDIDWRYKTVPQRHAAAEFIDKRLPWPSGKTLGGSSTINSMLYVRGNRRNYDNWAASGATGWSYEDVLPYFKKLENNTGPEFLRNGYHAVGGPITASKPAFYPIKKQATVEAVLSEGYNFVDSNAYEQVGFYDHQATIRGGQRCGTAKAYLVPSENRSNLDILTNARVTKVLIRNKQAYGVEFDFQGVRRNVLASKEVILSAGTVNSAQLLMLSGIGPMSDLKKLDIPVVADLPVGLNLQDHPITTLVYTVDKNVPSFATEIREKQHIEDYIDNRIGPLTSTNGIFLMAFLNNYDIQDNIPDHCLYFSDSGKTGTAQPNIKPEIMEKVYLPLSNESIIACSVQLVHPKSIGTVSLQSMNPYDPPLIDPNYFSDFHDVEDMVQGMKRCQRIMSNPAMKKINAKPVSTLLPGCEDLAYDEELYLRCIVRTITSTTNHQVGTAKMGDPADPSAVVDPQLRVKGISGLRVVDASVMPSTPWSNTNVVTIMIAEKASDIIKSTITCNSGNN